MEVIVIWQSLHKMKELSEERTELKSYFQN